MARNDLARAQPSEIYDGMQPMNTVRVNYLPKFDYGDDVALA
ncbi:MAG: hypothetical protein AB7G47_14465 [Mycolicibacterium sp.]